MSNRVTYTSHIAIAGCFDCGGNEALWQSKNAQAVAARHHDASGHHTWVDINISVLYGEKDGPPE